MVFRCFRVCAAALAVLVYAEKSSPAQVGGTATSVIEPQPYRVYQRDRLGFASVPVVVKDAEGKTIEATSWSVSGPEDTPVAGLALEDGAIKNLPTGGPYNISINNQPGIPVYVGDLWILAGQSNMEGVGDLVDVTPPHPRVMLLGMDGEWGEAKEPLHWLVDSPDPVHSGDPASRQERSKNEHKTRTKGAGLGLSFAGSMTEALNVPIGLIACAHGGTSMGQWSPDQKGEGGKSLYGSMLRQFKLAGGTVKGVLWYQGESDANPEAAPKYAKTMEDFIAAVRKDFDQPGLPFYLVQIGRWVRPGDGKEWNIIQDVQRQIPSRILHTGVVSVVDLELDDGIHVGTQGHKRAGHRLANLALRELFGHSGGSTPTFDQAFRDGNSVVIAFKGVNLIQEENKLKGLQPSRHIAGFSIRKTDGSELPLIFDAVVGPGPDHVTLKLNEPAPEGSFLWYGAGFNPYCSLTDHWDMAVPVFGPIPLDSHK